MIEIVYLSNFIELKFPCAYQCVTFTRWLIVCLFFLSYICRFCKQPCQFNLWWRHGMETYRWCHCNVWQWLKHKPTFMGFFVGFFFKSQRIKSCPPSPQILVDIIWADVAVSSITSEWTYLSVNRWNHCISIKIYLIIITKILFPMDPQIKHSKPRLHPNDAYLRHWTGP